MSRERFCAAVIVLSGLAHLALGRQFIRASSATFDEPVHLAAGYSYWRGLYRLNIKDHPPLAEMWEALPLFALRVRSFESHPDFTSGRPYHFADLFLQHNDVPAARMLDTAREFGLLSWTAILLPFLAWWAWRLAGPEAAAAASALFALTPALIANDSLVTTDAAPAAFAFAAFALLAAAVESRRPTRLAFASSVAAGLAMTAKYNMIVLPFGLLAMLAWDARFRRERRPDYAQLAVIVAAGAALTVGVVYRFDAGLYLAGVRRLADIVEKGRSSFFWGRHSTTGNLWYFPFAFAAKTPLPLLGFGLGGLAWFGSRRSPGWDWVALPMLAYFASALAVKVQIGHRHLLPVYPFWLLLAGGAAAKLAQSRAGRAAAAILIALQAASVARAHPYELAYFNEAVGGPSNGWKYLVDSNLDWGQALPQLKQWLSERGDPPIYFAYFGIDDPSAWGIRYHPAASASSGYVDRAGSGEPAGSDRIRLAISATHLQSTYYEDKTLFGWLQERRPEAQLGYSIFVYDLTGDADGRERLARVLERDGQSAEAARLRAWKAP